MSSRRTWTLAGRPVPADVVRQFVFNRDGECMAARFESIADRRERHACTYFQRAFGGGPTFEHVAGVHSHLDGRKDDERHGVALCAALNGSTLRLADHGMKEFFRAHLRRLYPACSTS